MAAAGGLAGAMGGIGSALSGVADIGNMIGSMLPTTTTSNFSGQTNKSTQRVDFDEDAIKRMLDLMMQSSEGLQATTSGEKQTGMFNSTTNQLMVDDLMARVVGEVATRAAPVIQEQILGPTTTKNKSKKCFITTAVCEHLGKPDDCYELETLRKFRNDYMFQNSERWIDVYNYYCFAPKIVEVLATLADKNTIYARFNDTYIQPAIVAIENNDYEFAHKIYTRLFNEAKQLAGL